MGDFSRKSVKKKQISPIMTSFCLEKARAIPSQAAHYTLDKSRLSLYPTLNLENSLSQNKAFFRIEVDYRKRLCIKWLGDTLSLEYELVEDSGTEILITPHIGC